MGWWSQCWVILQAHSSARTSVPLPISNVSPESVCVRTSVGAHPSTHNTNGSAVRRCRRCLCLQVPCAIFTRTPCEWTRTSAHSQNIHNHSPCMCACGCQAERAHSHVMHLMRLRVVHSALQIVFVSTYAHCECVFACVRMRMSATNMNARSAPITERTVAAGRRACDCLFLCAGEFIYVWMNAFCQHRRGCAVMRAFRHNDDDYAPLEKEGSCRLWTSAHAVRLRLFTSTHAHERKHYSHAHERAGHFIIYHKLMLNGLCVLWAPGNIHCLQAGCWELVFQMRT